MAPCSVRLWMCLPGHAHTAIVRAGNSNPNFPWHEARSGLNGAMQREAVDVSTRPWTWWPLCLFGREGHKGESACCGLLRAAQGWLSITKCLASFTKRLFLPGRKRRKTGLELSLYVHVCILTNRPRVSMCFQLCIDKSGSRLLVEGWGTETCGPRECDWGVGISRRFEHLVLM